MSGKRYTEEFKIEAVKQVTERGQPATEVASRLGAIYFSDSSTRFAPAEWGGTVEAALLDVLEQSSTGRVIEYDPAAKTTRVLAEGLSLANGVVLSTDEKDLYVAESGKYRVWKLPVGANKLDDAMAERPFLRERFIRQVANEQW